MLFTSVITYAAATCSPASAVVASISRPSTDAPKGYLFVGKIDLQRLTAQTMGNANRLVFAGSFV
ncbi:hypothetical protein T02_15028 [Trichinella nativa]|uniref:Uncharacterized protein n=2 Tax=Trichinella TaxID=6333 RepID=A0A0V1KYY2_9BILA|nr:hypothetical protein T05_4902 [Trichinella murrelli]KRZ52522.1 hypothetical protein T02_15028 [Trichinella nativa]